MEPQRAIRVVTFGELLLRLDAPHRRRLLQADRLEVTYTGGEANAAVALAQWGVEAVAVSKVPEHALGQACVNHLRRYGVRTEHVARGGPRLGILYVETGAAQRPTQVVYDREQTSFRQVEPGDFDWPAILRGASWLHLTGTVPAGGPAVRAALAEGLSECRRQGVPVSLDCSYRSSLWSREEASAELTALLPQVTLLLGSVEDPAFLFGIASTGADALPAISQQFGLRYVALTRRRQHSSHEHELAAVLWDSQVLSASREYALQAVDRIGAGDAFAAGVLFGLSQGWPSRETIEFAAAAACWKHSVPGDFCLATRAELQRLAEGEQSGRIVR